MKKATRYVYKPLVTLGLHICSLTQCIQPKWYDLLDRETYRTKILRRTKKTPPISEPASNGQVLIKFGIVEEYGSAAPDNWTQAWEEFLNTALNDRKAQSAERPNVADKDNEKATAEAKKSLLQKYKGTSDKSVDSTAIKFHGADLMGVMYIEVTSASDLPPERNGKCSCDSHETPSLSLVQNVKASISLVNDVLNIIFFLDRSFSFAHWI